MTTNRGWQLISQINLQPRETRLFAHLNTLLNGSTYLPLQAPTISSALGMHEKTVLTSLKDLVKKGLIEKGALIGKYPTYRLSPQLGWKLDDEQTHTAPAHSVRFYPLENVRTETHTAVIGESGSGKSLLTKYLILRYFNDANVSIYDCDATPYDWANFHVIGRGGNFKAIATEMKQDLQLLKERTQLRGEGEGFGGDEVRVIEEYPSTAAELIYLASKQEVEFTRNLSVDWLRRILRRGRKHRLKIFAVAQEFEVGAWKIEGEGGLRNAFSVFYLGGAAYDALSKIKDRQYRSQLQQYFDSIERPCLADVRGKYYPVTVPDLAKLERNYEKYVSTGRCLHRLVKKIERSTLSTPHFGLANTGLTLSKSSHPNPQNDVITLEEREAVLRSHFQNRVSQEKTILQVWGITKGTSVKYKAAREKYQQILKEAG